MKIFCIDKNYQPQEKTEKPILYMKPETALTREDWPFFVPDWSQQVECETHLVVRINHLGKSIPERFANRYYDEVTVGLTFTTRDIQNQLKEKGLPWEISTGFDGASYVGKWVKLDDVLSKHGDSQGVTKTVTPSQGGIETTTPSLPFSTTLNGQPCAEGNTADMLHSIDEIVSYVSQFYLLKTGDLIFTGSPSSFGPLKEGDLIAASLCGSQLLECRCK